MEDSKRSSNRAGAVVTVLSCLTAVLSCLAAWLVVPEFRQAAGMKDDAAQEEIQGFRRDLEHNQRGASETPDDWSQTDRHRPTRSQLAGDANASASNQVGVLPPDQSLSSVPLTGTLLTPVETHERLNPEGRASYAVAAYCYSVTEAQCQTMQRTIRDRGDTVIRGGLLRQRPSWLAPRSTVFFYDATAAADARQLAAILQGQTGIAFEVSQGSGLGVSSGQRSYSLRVHLIGSRGLK
jgi:hypothetical protein